MKDPVSLTPDISVGGQPTEADLADLKAEGYVAVVNLRRDGEAGQPLSPDAEGAAVRALGLGYTHIPVLPSDPSAEQVAALRAAIEAADGPVYVHCAAGQRAAALTLLATSDDEKAADLIAEATAKGFPITEPGLRGLIEKERG